MISMFFCYMCTLCGVIFYKVHDFLAMGIILTIVSVIWTLIHGARAGYSGKQKLLALAAHVLPWIFGSWSPVFIGKLIGTLIGLLIAAVIVLVVLKHFGSSGQKQSDEERYEPEEPKGVQVPAVIYDDDGYPFYLRFENGQGEADYEDDDGNKVHIYDGDFEGPFIHTNQGKFYIREK